MQIYNPTKYKWERDPNGKYAYGATCVRECPEHLLKDNGACVRACPEKKKVRMLKYFHANNQYFCLNDQYFHASSQHYLAWSSVPSGAQSV